MIIIQNLFLYLCSDIIIKESSGIMKKRRIKKSVIRKCLVLFVTFILIIILSVVVKTVKYHKTDEYKLKIIGYSKDEIEIIKTQGNDIVDYILNNSYNDKFDDIINEKYYIESNFERYVNYLQYSSDLTEVIAVVNVNRDKDEYTDTKKTDTEKKELMLTNKYNYLDKDYKPDDIITISSRYAYSGNEAPKEIFEYYKEMFDAAEADGVELIISSAYRDYKNQEETYEYYKQTKGEDFAKTYAALPGYSEHQTGLAFDILTTGTLTDDFEKTDEFEWLIKNSYKYGFILRYPKDKEKITGYDYESWHFRYVGKQAAKRIHDENITFDEYYAYYVEFNGAN